MNNNITTATFSAIFWSLFLIFISIIYYTYYLQPRDKALESIMACQLETSDHSAAGFQYCVDILKPQ